MAAGVWVKVRKFEEYKGRKDVTHYSWFRCSNRLLEDSDFFEFTHSEILVWIYILSLSSQKNSDTIFVSFAHADRICRLKKSVVQSAINKLLEKQLDPVSDTETLPARNGDVTSTGATNKQTDITNKQTDTTTAVAKPSRPRLSSLALQEFESLEGLMGAFDADTVQTWQTLYSDPTYLKRQAIKAWDYYRWNPAKLPKTLKGWKRALNHWFESDWAKHVKTLPAKSAGFGARIEDILSAREEAT